MSEPDRPPQPLVVSLALLTVVSGIVDAVSYLGLGHVFTANMTGNVVLVGLAIAGAPGFSLAANLCSLGCFVGGAIVGGRLALAVQPRRELLVWAVAIEAGFTAVAAIIGGTVAVVGVGWSRYTVIALLAFSMGMRIAVVRRMAVADMNTTVVTMTLTGLASESTFGGGANPNAAHRAASVLSLFGGALVGAVFEVHVHPGWALGLATGLLIATAVYFVRAAPLDIGLAS
ncbi:MAG TPA: YoaK family protein [Acidimicrobiales bacterium]|nr:YoaK family protein [Acidimicrobiales bacterium]